MDRRYRTQGKNLALLLALLVFDPVRCAAPQTAVLGAQFPPAIVITRGITAQGYVYLSGGVGSDERLALEERAKGFNVKLVFAGTDGSYIAGVKLDIADRKSEAILSTTITGPWFYIQLPPGIYHVKARFRGQIKEVEALRVGEDRTTHQVFVWDLGGSPKTAPKPKA
ncbi:MAG TPA: hypothetical protein VF208_06720 [Candidatus Binatia bacterium]